MLVRPKTCVIGAVLFSGAHDTKTEALVSEIADFEFIVTDSNIEALLLEINLIQENKPRYNIMLKDDKSHPFIKITKERHPRLMITRQIKRMAVSILVPIQMWSNQPDPQTIGASVSFPQVNCPRTSTVCIITWANVWPTGTRCLVFLIMIR